MSDNITIIHLLSNSDSWGYFEPMSAQIKRTDQDPRIQKNFFTSNTVAFDFDIPVDNRTLLSATIGMSQIYGEELIEPCIMRVLPLGETFGAITTNSMSYDFLNEVDVSENCGSFWGYLGSYVSPPAPKFHKIVVENAGLTAIRSLLSDSGGIWTGALLFENIAGENVILSREAGMTMTLVFALQPPVAGDPTDITETGFTSHWVSGN